MLIPGGTFSVTPDIDKPTTDDDPFSMKEEGGTLTKQIPAGGYTIGLTAPTGYTLVGEAQRNEGRDEPHASALLRRGPTNSSGAENTGIHIEPDQQLDAVGGQDTTVEEDSVFDEVIEILGGNDTNARKDPVEQAPTDDDPSDSSPAETTAPAPAPNDDSPTIVDPPPSGTVTVDTVPVETIPVETVPPTVEESPTVVPSTEAPATDGLTAECFTLLEMNPAVSELDPGLFGACEANPADAITIINELWAELGY